jgi:hypothetical protein
VQHQDQKDAGGDQQGQAEHQGAHAMAVVAAVCGDTSSRLRCGVAGTGGIAGGGAVVVVEGRDRGTGGNLRLDPVQTQDVHPQQTDQDADDRGGDREAAETVSPRDPCPHVLDTTYPIPTAPVPTAVIRATVGSAARPRGSTVQTCPSSPGRSRIGWPFAIS